MWTMCEFHDSNGNGFGDIGWTDKLIYFIIIDVKPGNCRMEGDYDYRMCEKSRGPEALEKT